MQNQPRNNEGIVPIFASTTAKPWSPFKKNVNGSPQDSGLAPDVKNGSFPDGQRWFVEH
jgi:hypothetical protein